MLVCFDTNSTFRYHCKIVTGSLAELCSRNISIVLRVFAGHALSNLFLMNLLLCFPRLQWAELSVIYSDTISCFNVTNVTNVSQQRM